MTEVETEVSMVVSPVSKPTSLTVYSMMSPFWSLARGGDQEKVTVSESIIVASKFRGSLLGTRRIKDVYVHGNRLLCCYYCFQLEMQSCHGN